MINKGCPKHPFSMTTEAFNYTPWPLQQFQSVNARKVANDTEQLGKVLLTHHIQDLSKSITLYYIHINW
jgi:hypothetical protein